MPTFRWAVYCRVNVICCHFGMCFLLLCCRTDYFCIFWEYAEIFFRQTVHAHTLSFVGRNALSDTDKIYSLGVSSTSSHYDVRCLVFSERQLTFTFATCCRPFVCLPSVGKARTQAVCNFPQYFYDVWYLGHPLTSTKSFTEIIPGEPSIGGVKHRMGSQI